MASIVVRVQKLDGSILEVAATRSWTVIDVKKEVTRSDGTPWKEQKLVFAEKELTDLEQLDAVLPQEAAVDVTLVRTQNLAGAWAVLTQDRLSQEDQTMRDDAVARAQKMTEATSSWGALAGETLTREAQAAKDAAQAQAEAKKAG
mmetsp:Transcript_33732/g.104790  ORF Transcript_33732/g.104790 Transcript_33732/m.104790 type:complete len:146 (-) Transcript_33732:148-585(-)|eukprot:CAMPEP_0204581554 /NCGR_PEP_ID=MMETSP0661-20131031/44710_1 /ASSEMBLY_ACC=CAM_ASM_000606 /TAXON_ID=109239 /ORGANISM="Alexandrium margalefi, Strain AMGDE01CS-322" /LENGTH=145 /DNA_ID=CAMNT_0051590757 /DNA_START=98 /DNA_END=535 /DNA_ORIENTATION=+